MKFILSRPRKKGIQKLNIEKRNCEKIFFDVKKKIKVEKKKINIKKKKK